MLKPEGIITDLDKEYSEVGKKLVSHIEKWIEKHSIANPVSSIDPVKTSINATVDAQ